MKDMTTDQHATTNPQVVAWLADAEERGIQVTYLHDGLGCVLANVKAMGQNGFRRSGSKLHTVYAKVVLGSLDDDPDSKTYAWHFIKRTSEMGKVRHCGREYDPWNEYDAIIASAHSPCNGNGQHISRVTSMKYDAKVITCGTCR